MEKQPKLEWKPPLLEMLDVSITMGGPNGCIPDLHSHGGNNRDKPCSIS